MTYKLRTFGFLDPRVEAKLIDNAERQDLGIFIEKERPYLFSFEIEDDRFSPETIWGALHDLNGLYDLEVQWDFHDRAMEEAFGIRDNEENFEKYGKKGYYTTFGKSGYVIRPMR